MPRPRRGRGLKVIIAGAGGAAHLPGMAAAMTPLPVLGVPVESHALKGMDSLLSIVQMPAGIPVGTLAIGRAGAINAALLAAAILALATPRWPAGWMPGGRRRPRACPSRLEPTRMTSFHRPLPAAARRHHRHPRRRPARPDVGAGRGAARLSLPRLRAGGGQPGHAGGRRRHRRPL